MLIKTKKSILGFLVAIIIAGSVFTANTYNVSAADNDTNDQIEELSETYNIPEEELKELSENLEIALGSVPDLEVGEDYQVPISDNIVLEISVEDDGMPIVVNPFMRATYTRTITSTLRLKNMFGATVVTMNSVGVFQTNGSTSKPIDAYGTHTATVWNVSSKKATKGATAYNAYVRNTFTGKFNIGIDPVSMTIQSFTYVSTIYCNAKGTYSSSWK